MRNKNQRGIFEEEDRLKKLTSQKDPLVKLHTMIKWDQFKPILTKVFKKEAKGAGGRPNFDYLMMFKILILQRYYNISDDQTEYQILDRLSFMRFLGLTINDRVPDSKTIWHFRESLVKAAVVEKLFDKFGKSLEKCGLIINEGKIVDASFVEIPRQRNTREENEQIKNGEVPKEWEENPNKLSQKDLDARWTKKNNTTYYGYKDHVKVDSKSKLIDKYAVTDASVHDSQVLEQLLENKDKEQKLYADSAYTGEDQEKVIAKKKMINKIHEKGYRNKELTKTQIRENKRKSKVRARVEHVFGFIENNMSGSYIRTIGKNRAEAIIGLINLTYNIFRGIQLLTYKGGKSVCI